MSRRDGSLWLRLLTDLRRRLELGAFDDGFPGELALVEEYQVSRHTVRETLRVLREEGVLVAARGRAPRLVGPVEIAQRIAPTPAEQRLLGVTPDVALFAIERVGCSHGRPVEWRYTLVRGDRFTVTADIAAHDGYRLEQRGGDLVGMTGT